MVGRLVAVGLASLVTLAPVRARAQTPAPPVVVPPGPLVPPTAPTQAAPVVVPPPGVMAPPMAAQQPPSAYAMMPSPYSTLYARRLYEDGESMHATGKVLSFIGVGLLAGATALLVVSASRETFHEAGPYAVGGAAAFIGGLAGIGVGIPFWLIGSHRMDRAIAMGYVPQAVVSPVPGGALAGLRLATF